MSRQQQLELLGLHCTVCGGALRLENCNADFERYACPSCGSKYRLPPDIDRFKEYRAEMLKKFGSLSRRGPLVKPKQDLLIDLDGFAKTYQDFVKDDSQYHLFYIAAITENFQMKFKGTDPICQEAADTYCIISGDKKDDDSFPIDIYGKKIIESYKRWSTPRRMPLWSKIAISAGVAAIATTAPILAACLDRNITNKDTGISIHIDSSDYGMLEKWRVRFNVERLLEGTAEYSAATALLKNESKKYIVYDMTMLSGDELAAPGDKLKITMPLPEDYIAKNTVVYYITPDGKCELIEGAEVVEATRTVTFETDHFSLYAIAERPFHVSFLPENGATEETVTVNWGGLLEAPSRPERAGYTFGGWYNGTQKWDFDSNIVGDNITLKAAWIPNQYTAAFDTNGGSPVTDFKVTYDDEFTLPKSSRVGYDFIGWYDSEGVKHESGIWKTASNLTLTAKWAAESYEVSFDSAGGSSAGKITATYGSPYGKMPEPSRTGYTFLGWFSDSEGSTAIAEDTAMTTAKNHTLYAQWEANSYTVSFNSLGGSEIGDIQVTFDSTYGSLPTPLRTGYTFLGWFTSEQNGERVLGETVVSIASSVTLYAGWSTNAYTVSFDTCVSGISCENINVSYDAKYGTLPEPNRIGYTFLGWFTERKGGEAIDSETTVKINTATTLYAHWQANEYTVSFDTNGGENSIDPITVTFDTKYGTLPIPTRTGYSFNGWYILYLGGDQRVITDTYNGLDHDHTLHAKWTPIIYTVHLNAGEGELSFGHNQYISYNSTYGNLPKPTRTGYNFMGWFTESDGGSKIEAATVMNTASEHTIYAHWEIATYTVTLNNAGGNSDTETTARQYMSPYGTLPTPTKTGYDFAGWYTDSLGGNKITSETLVTVGENHTIYAHWTPKSYRVTLNACGGAISDSAFDVTYGNAYGELPDPTRLGYTFVGWYTAEYGGSLISISTPVDSAKDHALYAHWSFPVVLEPQGGNLTADGIEVSYNDVYGNLPIPTRTGYGFDGWYTEAEGGSKVTYNTKVTVDSTHALYAHWSVGSCTVFLDANGGSHADSSITATYNEKYTDLADPERKGYIFLGWFTEREGGTEITASTTVTSTENHTLYAHWVARTAALTLDTNGGICDELTVTVTYNSSYPDLPAPTKIGHDFLGWFTEAEEGTLITEDTVVTTDEAHTVYAHWEASTYNIIWELDGGTAQDIHPMTYTYGTAVDINSLSLPTKEGMVFIGWYKNDGITDVYTAEIAAGEIGDITLTAKWYEANGSWTKPESSLMQGKTTTATSATITRDDEYIIAIPEEMRQLISEGKIAIEITIYHYMELVSQGNATATAYTHAVVNGTDIGKVCGGSVKGGGYGGFLWTTPKNGSTKKVSGAVIYTLTLTDETQISIGSFCKMTSNKDNADVKTKFFYEMGALEFRFYNVEPEDSLSDKAEQI